MKTAVQINFKFQASSEDIHIKPTRPLLTPVIVYKKPFQIMLAELDELLVS